MGNCNADTKMALGSHAGNVEMLQTIVSLASSIDVRLSTCFQR